MTTPMFQFEAGSDEPLVVQIERAVRDAIVARRLLPGQRLWSIRRFAAEFGVSTFTVVDAYDRLVADGFLLARRGDGFFVAAERGRGDALAGLPTVRADAFWLADSLYEPPAGALTPGSGWLPHDWFEQDAVRTALRVVAAEAGPLTGYGEPKGWRPLREWLQRTLAEEALDVGPEQLLLTQGASQALTLAAAALTRPGDTVLVDDPGYLNLHTALSLRELNVVGVPWTPNGPDLARLALLLDMHRPKVFFTNPWLQNPTGASYSPQVAYRVLQLAEQHDFWIVENDVSAGLAERKMPLLASLEQLKRVLYVGSFSKTVAGSLRVGFVAADRAVVDALTHHKMLAGLTSSELCERMALQLLTEGRHRRRLARLRERLTVAREASMARLTAHGLVPFTQAGGGMFLWMGLPADQDDAVALAEAGVREQIMLAPGAVFRPGHAAAPFLRFNVAYSDSPRLSAFLDRALGSRRAQP